MIDTYLTDTVDIYTETFDTWGNMTEAIQSDVYCRIEDRNTIIKDKDGKEVVGEMVLFFNDTASITYTDKIKIKTKTGSTYTLTDKKYPVKKISKMAGFVYSHWEVWI